QRIRQGVSSHRRRRRAYVRFLRVRHSRARAALLALRLPDRRAWRRARRNVLLLRALRGGGGRRRIARPRVTARARWRPHGADRRTFDALAREISLAAGGARRASGCRRASLSGVAALSAFQPRRARRGAGRAGYRIPWDAGTRRSKDAAAGFIEQRVAQCIVSRLRGLYGNGGVS